MKYKLASNNILLNFLDIDDCVGVNCQNGGVCVDGVDSYSCTCVQGYAGTHCEIGTCSFIYCTMIVRFQRDLLVLLLKVKTLNDSGFNL